MSSNFKSWSEVLEAEIDGWKLYKLGELFSHRKDRNHPDLPLLSVTGNGGIVARDTLKKRDTSNADKSKYLRVLPEDIAYNTMRMWQGVSGKADKEGIVSPAYTICNPKNEIFSDYAKYLFKLKLLIQVFHRNSQGLVNDTLNLKFNHFSPIKVIIPPLPEQKKIASILTSVDDVIEKTETQISKLQDLKKGMMTELLTKGIGHTEFKDSPVGRIPVEWEVKRLEEVVNKNHPITYGIVQAGAHVENGVPYIRVSDMTRGKLSVEGMLMTSQEIADQFTRSEVNHGDIVYALRGKIGLVLPVPKSLAGANLTQGTARIAPADTIDADFLLWALRSPVVMNQSELEAKGSTFKEITLGKLKQLLIPIPPLPEQAKIASILASIDTNIESKQQKLSQTKALKKALMNDLLTGKVRVSTTTN